MILAAGMGTRLRSEHSGIPKGLIRLGGLSIIEESFMRLRAAGIQQVVLVTGYEALQYERLAEAWPGFCFTVNNPEFARSGSMYSLYCARHHVDGPFLLLESDLVYESRALEALMGCAAADAILLSGPTGAGDEVYVQTRAGLLTGMSKNRQALDGDVSGELVGISRISADLYKLMLELAGRAFEHSLAYDYETDCLVAAAEHRPIACPVIPDLVWGEIDDPGHLERVREQVYPRLDRVESPT